MSEKSNILFREWYDNQPKRNSPYIKQRLLEELGWTENIFHNKLTRTRITPIEQRVINTIFSETIFDLRPISASLVNN